MLKTTTEESSSPRIPLDVLEWLEGLYPVRRCVPELTDDERAIWVRVGNLQVVERVRAEYSKQNKKR